MGSQGGKGHPGFSGSDWTFEKRSCCRKALLLESLPARQVVFRSDNGFLAEARSVVRREVLGTLQCRLFHVDQVRCVRLIVGHRAVPDPA